MLMISSDDPMIVEAGHQESNVGAFGHLADSGRLSLMKRSLIDRTPGSARSSIEAPEPEKLAIDPEKVRVLVEGIKAIRELGEVLDARQSALDGRQKVVEKQKDQKLVSQREAARRLGISKNSIPVLIKSRQLAVVKVGSRKKISVSEIQRLCREGFTLKRA